MPRKYHIESSPVAGRFPPVTRSGVIAWQEGCLKCARCVKQDCVYGVYQKRGLDPHQMTDSLDTLCQDCFRCVQNCAGRLIQKSINPRYKALGDHYWTPEIITKLWYQAETSRIPVSGAGYGGPFTGPGFDSMWTDMSEIVRPTRDGIHGREYINTLVDLGRKPMALEFDNQGRLCSKVPPLVEIPLPVIFDIAPFSPPRERLNQVLLQGAAELGTFAIIPIEECKGSMESFVDHLLPSIEADSFEATQPQGFRIVEVADRPDVMRLFERLKALQPEPVVSIRHHIGPHSEDRTLELTRLGAEIIHLKADQWGREQGESPLFIKERVKAIHLHLVEAGIRDQVTLIAGGGVAMAEHMAKLIICGADAVSVDLPLMIAMECTVCRRCQEGLECPVELDRIDPSWGASRIRNLMSGWHSQLLEILGAMGLREVRRLRGEMGRAIFFEELEEEFFSTLGKTKMRS